MNRLYKPSLQPSLILSNFVTHETINFNGRHNPWIELKSLQKNYVTENKYRQLFSKDKCLQKSREFIS